jgi:PIN domain nuclease of toxin-antitoxin system
MVRAVADTHAVIWYLYADGRLSANARNAIERAAASGDQVAFSAITLVEIVYLTEKGRIQPDTYARLLSAIGGQDAVLAVVPLDDTVAGHLHQVERDQVPDMPDRIIAATALTLGVPVISRDSKIQLSSVATIW